MAVPAVSVNVTLKNQEAPLLLADSSGTGFGPMEGTTAEVAAGRLTVTATVEDDPLKFESPS